MTQNSICPKNPLVRSSKLHFKKDFSVFENLSGLYDLKRHDNITPLNDLNSLFGFKKSKAACWMIAGPAIRNLSSLNDLNKTPLTEHDVAINLATKSPILVCQCGAILVSQCGMDHQKSTILWMFGTFSVGGCGLDTILSAFSFFFFGLIRVPL